jgi:hypothetical protein
VIPVKINHAGPFDFMVDTGSQLTASIHPSPRNSTSMPKPGSALFPWPPMLRRPQLFWTRWRQMPGWSRNHRPSSRTSGRFRQPILASGGSRSKLSRSLRPARRLRAQTALSRNEDKDPRKVVRKT